MICPRCKMEIKEQAKFCEWCGMLLKSEDISVAQDPAEADFSDNFNNTHWNNDFAQGILGYSNESTPIDESTDDSKIQSENVNQNQDMNRDIPNENREKKEEKDSKKTEETLRRCPKCGEKRNKSDLFCPGCGTVLYGTEFSSNKNNNASDESGQNNGTSQITTNEKIFGALAYCGLLFIISIIMRNDSKFISFHTNQGIGCFILSCISVVLSNIIGLLSSWYVIGIVQLWSFFLFILAIAGIISAATGKMNKLPILSGFKIIK